MVVMAEKYSVPTGITSTSAHVHVGESANATIDAPNAATRSPTERSVGTLARRPVASAPKTDPTPAIAASNVKPDALLSNTLVATIGSTARYAPANREDMARIDSTVTAGGFSRAWTTPDRSHVESLWMPTSRS